MSTQKIYRVIINDCPIALALKTHTNFGCAASLATLDELVDRFPLPPVAPPIDDTSLIHVMRQAANLNIYKNKCARFINNTCITLCSNGKLYTSVFNP
jgi:hypothetical protein